MKRQIVATLLASSLLFGQAVKPTVTPTPPSAAAAKPIPPAAPKPPVAKPPAALAPSGIDTVIQLVKNKLPESMIIKTLRTAGKAYSLTPQDMLKLTQAGVSENIMNVMMDPGAAMAAVAAAPVAVSAPAPAEPAPVVQASAPVNPAPKVEKRRLAVTPFDYSAVKTWVTYWFGQDYNVGQGIRAMLTTRIAKLGTIRLVERGKVDSILKEQDFGAGGRVEQSSRAKIGKILGADAILFGDIIIFGRDDKKNTSRLGGITKGIFGVDVGKFKKEEKAVVAISYRIVDAETGEILDTGEARGESKRESKDWSVFTVKSGVGAGGASQGMESSNFAETIIGEATLAACDKLAEEIGKKVPALPIKTRVIDAMIASVQGNNIYINFGANEGVQIGDRFEVHQVTGIVKDPDTKEVLDKQTVKIGDLVISQVRDKISIGSYSGPPLSQGQLQGQGYAARKTQ